VTTSVSVLYGSALTAGSFDALLRGDLLALCVHDYFDVDADAVARATRLLAPIEGHDRQPVSYGAALTELLDGPRERYFGRAATQNSALAEIFGPDASPFVQLQRDLERCWPSGVTAAYIDGGVMSSGTVRYYRPGDLMNPHIDRKGHLAGDVCSACRLSVNIYLAVPADGGELELWDLRPNEEQAEHWHLADYSLDRNQIGLPDLVLRPAPGDLIMFNPEQIHAVAAVRTGSRLTASCFLGIRASNQPMSMFA